MPAAVRTKEGIEITFTFQVGDMAVFYQDEVVIIREPDRGNISLEIQEAVDPEKDYSWTQPLCDWCWTIKNPDRRPTRMRNPVVERCCNCNHLTNSGIYIRIDPKEANYPTMEK